MSVREGSRNAMLLKLGLSECLWIETSLDTYAHTMRTYNTPKSRRPPELQGREFTTTFYTAIGTELGDIRYLICLKRIT